MAINLLTDVGQKLINATRDELIQAIQSACGRIVIGETVTFKQSLFDGASNAELIKGCGCDMATYNHYNVDMPMIPGLSSTEEGIGKFFSFWNEKKSKGIIPDIMDVEESFQITFLQFGFGRTINDVSRLIGIPVGITLEPVEAGTGYPNARIATKENAKRAMEHGAKYINLITIPKMSPDSVASCIEQTREGIGNKGLIKVGKMPWGASFKLRPDEFITAEEIQQFAKSGADAIIVPSPGTIPGLTIELVKKWIDLIHECGILAETTVGTSQEGADPDVIRRIAIDSKMAGADMYQIGDSVYNGSCSPSNILAFAKAIKGERHTMRRVAASPVRGGDDPI